MRRDSERLRRTWRAGLEYFGLAEDPSRPPEGTPRRPDWFLVMAPVVWGLVVGGRTNVLFGLVVGAALAPWGLNELREARGGSRFRRTHPYLDALLGVPLAVGVVALIVPGAASGWFLVATLLGGLLGLLSRRRELVRKANDANRLSRTHAA